MGESLRIWLPLGWGPGWVVLSLQSGASISDWQPLGPGQDHGARCERLGGALLIESGEVRA